MKLKTVVIFVLILIVNIIFFNINIVKASGISDVITGGDDFISAGQETDDVKKKITLDEQEVINTSNYIYNILLISGMSIAVIISSILGIKFMIGSVEEKAQIKDALIPFVIGCIVIFGAFGIWRIFITIGNSL